MVKQILIALDQFLNTLIKGGYADETISARCYRERHKPSWAKWMKKIDWFFYHVFDDPSHCFKSYISELERNQLPKEYRPNTDIH